MLSAPDYMAIATGLSRGQRGRTGDNPNVGCVIVKNGRVIGRGATAGGGRPHAETQALFQAGDKARGADVYVTLEPCAHHGQTPPCADALIAAGIARCYIAIIDPDKRVNYQGAARLQEAGIDTQIGLGEDAARDAMHGWLVTKS